jgi:hypothetical protein
MLMLMLFVDVATIDDQRQNPPALGGGLVRQRVVQTRARARIPSIGGVTWAAVEMLLKKES